MANILVIVHFVLNCRNGPPDLPVSLTVELVGPNVGLAGPVSGIQAKQVSRNALIRTYLYNVTNPYVLGHDISNDARVAVEPLVNFLI